MAMTPATPARTPVTIGQRSRGAVWAAWRDVNVANVTAGLTAVLWYVFGAIPVFLGVMATIDPPADVMASWFFIVFVTSGVGTLLLSVRYRQPIPIGWTFPGLMLLGSASARYNLAELTGASLAAGAILLALGLVGIGERLMRWLPLPLALGMFAGSSLHYVLGIFAQFDVDPAVVGAALGGYLLARAVNRAWLPPVGGAVALGTLAAALTGRVGGGSLAVAAPQLVLTQPSFEPGSLVTLALPLVVLVLATGNVQGLGVLLSQGYHAPVNAVTTVVGVSSLVNALFGGHQATVQSAGSALLAGEDAGPPDKRYVGAVIAGIGCIAIALAATTAIAMLDVLPPSLIASMAGLAILRLLMDVLEKTLASDLRTGGFFALVIAASPLTLLGIGSAFWALAGGYLVSSIVERPALQASLRRAAATT
jgi:benzoate membrane transport protein